MSQSNIAGSMDEDFSFLSEGPRRPSRPSATQAGQQTPKPGSFNSNSNTSRPGQPVVTIPSFTEVHTAQQPSSSNALNSFFQPKGLLSAHKQQQLNTGRPIDGSNEPGNGIHFQQPMASNFPSPQTLPYANTLGNGTQQMGSSSSMRSNPATESIRPHTPPTSHAIASSALQGLQQPSVAFIQSSSTSHASPIPATATVPVAGNAIIVSKRQTGNPVLKSIRNVRWVFGDIAPDYLIGANACALFLSLRYHLLHPSYILYRIKELQRSYALRILLVLVDIEDVVQPLADVTKAAALNDFTLICAWSPERIAKEREERQPGQEAGRYLETFKAYENKPAHGIQERVEGDYASRLVSALTAVRAVNRTDAMALGAQFGTLASIMTANAQQLSACPGIGPTKVQNLLDAFHKPFKRSTAPVSMQSTTQPFAVSHEAVAGVQNHSTIPLQRHGPGPVIASIQHAVTIQQDGEHSKHRTTNETFSQQPDGQSGMLAATPGTASDTQVTIDAAKNGKRSGTGSTGMVIDVTNAPTSSAPESSKQTATSLHGAAATSNVAQATEDQQMMLESGIEEDSESQGTGEDSDHVHEIGDQGHGLLQMASQIMLQVQAGALVTGAVQSEDEGSDLSDHLEQDAENI